MQDAKRDFPAFHRNIRPLTEKLRELLKGESANVLEIGSGSGQHAVSFAQAFAELMIQPTDVDPENLASINAWIEDTGVKNVDPAQLLDVTAPGYFIENKNRYSILLCFNVVHITPWKVTESLFALADNVMKPHGRIFLYGPFRIDGKQTGESNEQFELWLKSKDERFGVRDIDKINEIANQNSFSSAIQHPMPANNFLMEFTRA